MAQPEGIDDGAFRRVRTDAQLRVGQVGLDSAHIKGCPVEGVPTNRLELGDRVPLAARQGDVDCAWISSVRSCIDNALSRQIVAAGLRRLIDAHAGLVSSSSPGPQVVARSDLLESPAFTIAYR